MNEYRQIKVAPYAMLDAIKALESCDVKEMIISKEDNDLILRWAKADEELLPKGNAQTCVSK